ncbi:MAG TPA: hypothetical protein VIK86_01540 [Candidatus Paceibacterota bacterium]
MKKYLIIYLPALVISIILFIVLPQENKSFICFPVIVAGLIYIRNKRN